MEKTSQRKLNDALRARYVDRVKSLLESVGDEVTNKGIKVIKINPIIYPPVGPAKTPNPDLKLENTL